MKFSIYLFASLLATTACQQSNPNETEVLSTIAIGSCSHQDQELQLWSEIDNQRPDLFILTGDNIYADTEDMQLMKSQYEKQKSRPAYQQLMKNVPIIGIWDDHDYGLNDGGKHFLKKDSSKILMLDFLDVAKDNPVWGHPGAYNSYTYGPKDKKVKVLLLDARYFRDDLVRDTISSAKYFPNKDGDILGEAQWKWLDEELTDSDAAIHMLVSGIQVIAEEHNYEKWSNFPSARQRLLDLLVKTQPKGAFFISGDRHISEISKQDIDGLSYPLYDFTASGLTHTWGAVWSETNKHRVGERVAKKNYGLIKIDWANEKPDILFQVKGHGDSTFLEHRFNL